MARTAEVVRETKETQIRVWIDLDGTGASTISTGMEVSVVHGHLSGLQGKVVAEADAEDAVDVYIELRSLRLLRRIPKSAVRPLSSKR